MYTHLYFYIVSQSVRTSYENMKPTFVQNVVTVDDNNDSADDDDDEEERKYAPKNHDTQS